MSAVIRPELARLIVSTYDTREAWLDARAAPDTIGASEAAMALGVSPYGTPWALYEAKRGPRVEKRNSLFVRGHRWEPSVLSEYEDESRHRVLTPAQAVGKPHGTTVMLANPRLPWLRQTPDAFALDVATGQLGQVEAKTAFQAYRWSPEHGIVIDRWDDSHADLIPPHIAIQVYVQLIVSDLPWVDACALVPRNGWLAVRWVRFERDPETQASLEAALTEWRERHLLAGEPPELDGSEDCNHYLTRTHPTGKGRAKASRFAQLDEVELMRELAELRAQRKAVEQRLSTLSNRLLDMAQGEALCVPGYIRGPYGQPQHCAGRRSVDVDALRREAPELVARHETRGKPYSTFNLYRFDQLNEET